MADALYTPICSGEYVYGVNPFRQLIENQSIDIVMIDLLRVGGITPWRKVAAMAEAFNMPVVSHPRPRSSYSANGIHTHRPDCRVHAVVPATLGGKPPPSLTATSRYPTSPALGWPLTSALRHYAVG